MNMLEHHSFSGGIQERRIAAIAELRLFSFKIDPALLR